MPPRAVEAASFTVNSTADAVDANIADGICQTATPGECTLRAAVQQANANSGADVITLPAGVYVLTIPGAFEDAAATGDLDINGSLTIAGAGVSTTIIDGGGIDRVIQNYSSSVSINAVTVRNGNADVGAGIFNCGGSMTLTNVAIKSNAASNAAGGIFNCGTLALADSTVTTNVANGLGGGIENRAPGTVLIIGSSVSGNIAQSVGGGIFNEQGAIRLDNSTVEGNSAASGGGLFSTGSATISATGFAGNSARQPNGNGGGIYNAFGTIDLRDSVLDSNSAAVTGGGIANYDGGTITMTGTTVTHNSATAVGGGIANRADMAVSNSSVESNTAQFVGGGIAQLGGALQIKTSSISANSAQSGGGVYSEVGVVVSGLFSVENSTIAANVAIGGGGGVYNYHGVATMTGTTVSGNQAGFGGGMLGGGVFTLTNVTISGNEAIAQGGGILACECYLNNVTITENVAPDGGGIAFDSHVERGGTAAVANTIIAGNHNSPFGDNPHADCGGDGIVTSLGYNILPNNFAGPPETTNCTVQGDPTGNITGQAPQLAPLAGNGGATRTHALLANSPAIDTGNPALPGSGGNACASADQRGISRPQGPRCDIGAFELMLPPNTGTATATSTPCVGPCATATATATPSVVGVNKIPEGDSENTNPAIPAANLWLCAGACAGMGEGNLLVTEHATNVHSDDNADGIVDVPDLGLGAYEFQVEYDNFVIQSVNPCDIVFSPGGAGAARGNVTQLTTSAGCTANPTPINGDCTMSLVLENVIRFGCVTLGQTPGPTGDMDLARLNLIPHPDLTNDIFPGNNNGVVTIIKDNGCELVDIFGHAVAGSINGGLTPVCGDLAVTVRILEGDLNLDCTVNLADEQLIASRYGGFFGSLLYSKWYDLEPATHDLDIDIKDLQKVFGRDGSTCQHPTPAQPPLGPPAPFAN